MTVGRTSPAELEELIRSGGRVGQIYTGLARLRDRCASLIREKFPRIRRRVSGYNLDDLLGENGFHVARALVGSEGLELMQVFREFKALWDPDNRMNPGKLVDPVRVYDPIQNLRQGPAATPGEAHPHAALETHFVFAKDGGSLERATERCVGVGGCRKTTGGVMCPSYRATGEEQNSTSGRARLLWEMLAGALREEGFQCKAVHQALDLCLSCKACKSECPVQVDMAGYKSEFLAQRYKRPPAPAAPLHLRLL